MEHWLDLEEAWEAESVGDSVNLADDWIWNDEPCGDFPVVDV